MPANLPPPWTSRQCSPEAFAVYDANGFAVVHVYFSERVIIGTSPDRLTRDQARRVAANIAKLPQLLLGDAPAAPTTKGPAQRPGQS